MSSFDEAVKSLMYITNRPPAVMVSGNGSWVTDHEGRRYLDFIQGWAVNCLGHSPNVIVDALVRQAERLINPSPAFFNEPSIRLAGLITGYSCFDRVFFASSGAEANEGAIKLARKWGSKFKDGAFEIITMEHGFHGRTLATMSATGKSQWRELYEPKVPGFPKVPFNDLAAVEAALTDKTVAVMLEPVQGEAGVVPADVKYLQALMRLTREKGILLIFDEIQTGMGRTGTLFAYQQTGVEPDIMTLGKGLGGGVPLTALVAKEEVCCFEPGDQGGTFNGNPLMTAVGCAVMEELTRPGFLERVRETGEYLTSRIWELSGRFGLGEVRGKGLLIALDLKEENSGILADKARDNGLLLNAPSPRTLRFMPALTVDREEVDEMIRRLERVFDSLMTGDNSR
jgi:acetylornithine/N-succinyldiaminopimelate aminotransferase